MTTGINTIAVFSTTRAEYGLLYPLLKVLSQTKELKYLLFVGGTHLASEHGKTISEIYSDPNISITDTFDFILNEDSPYSLAQSIALETFQLTNLFKLYQFDMVLVLGDRIELLPIIENAIIFKKPIIHLYGGEKTQGAIDDQIRNMISKAAHVHFVSCEEYKKNLELLGENSNRIYVVGSLATDNMMNLERIKKEILFQELNLNPEKPTILLSYHPVTLEFEIEPAQQIKNIFTAIEKFDFQILITSPNIDPGHKPIIDEIKKQVSLHSNYRFVESLGMVRFHSLLPHCTMVIGNSSSGIVEVPYYKIPTVNIGNRQKGRLRHPSVIDVGYDSKDIIKGIHQALNVNFLESIKDMPYKFGDGLAAQKIINVLKNIKIDDEFIRK